MRLYPFTNRLRVPDPWAVARYSVTMELSTPLYFICPEIVGDYADFDSYRPQGLGQHMGQGEEQEGRRGAVHDLAAFPTPSGQP